MATFDAIGLTATDMAATLDFYRLAGLDIPTGSEHEDHVEVELGGGMRLMFDTIDLVNSFSRYEPPQGGRNVGFAMRCDSPEEVDQTYARAIAAGHRSKTEPFDAFWGQRYASVLDPDGTPVDFYAALPD